MTPRNVLDATTELLQEEGTGIHWTEAKRLAWFNEGLKALVQYRPKFFTKHATHSCAAGADQTVAFARAVTVLDVIRIENGAAVTKADRDTLDAFLPGWIAGTQGPAVHWFPDDVPLAFGVYPPSPAGQNLVVNYIEAPADVAENSTAPVPDIFLPILTDYVMYRCYLKDGESEGNAKLAGVHWAAFEKALKE